MQVGRLAAESAEHRRSSSHLVMGAGSRERCQTPVTRGARAATDGGGRVIAPSDADETSAAYFAKAPVEYRACGGDHAAIRAASASSSTAALSVRAATSISTTSPSA